MPATTKSISLQRVDTIIKTALITLAMAVGLAACQSTPSHVPNLGSLLYPVYGYDRETGECTGGLGSSAWNDGGAPVVVEPVAGFYCFGSPEYQETTIALMEEYGFDWTLVSYNGWGDVDLNGSIEFGDFEAAHRDIDAFFSKAEGRIEVALLVEPYVDLGGLDPAFLTSEQKTIIRDKIWVELYQPHADSIFHWQGRPLLVQWFPMDLGRDDRFTIKTFGSSKIPDEPLLDWNWYPALEIYPDIISDDGFVSFAPRFDEFYMWLNQLAPTPRRMDPFLEEDIYGKFWDMAYENREDINLILIYSWNAYGEQAVVEPVLNGPLGTGGPDGLGLLEQTRDGINRLAGR